MSRLRVLSSITLDGVMQAPGRPDEDRRDGFEHGGWALPYNDPVMGRVMGEGMARDGAELRTSATAAPANEIVFNIGFLPGPF